ncbi:AIM24 family protein [Clostridium vitabionis]|uniref:AIM24 family protein n=1 Tax=Clostridium vitabionis TaxID=2784388 RepID=UPI00188BB0A4|nr:AIM24 family protein [Clostridium vitabionis]
MIRTNLFQPTEAHKIVAKKGRYSLLEYDKDLSVTPESASTAFFASQMNVKKRQVIAELNNDGGVILQAGAMQLMLGTLHAATNIKGAGDLMKKFVGSKVTGETTIKPRYEGTGLLVLEPTYRYILFEDLSNWNGNMVIEDGMFLACDDSISMKVTARTTISSAVLGGEGLFNTALTGTGIAVLESPVPAEELIVVDLDKDVIRIDGNMAIAWSKSLEFTVERTTRTLVGSAASGEGLVNVYRGTGRVLIAPVANNRSIATPKPTK